MSVKSGAALLLFCMLLLLAVYLANRQRHITPPAANPPAPATSSTPAPAKSAPPEQQKPLKLSIDEQLEFAPPPDLFSKDDEFSLNNGRTELFDTLAKPPVEQDGYSLSGKVLLEEEPDYSLDSIEGLQLEVEIKTD